MDIQTIALLGLMALMVLGVAFIIFRFIKSILEKRAYEREVLPGIYESEIEDVILPDIEESGFSSLGEDFSSDEESASEMYREIYEESSDRSSK